MGILGYILVGCIAYLIVGNIVAIIMKLMGSNDCQTESEFKTVIALWPAPVLIGALDWFITIITIPFGKIYDIVAKLQKH